MSHRPTTNRTATRRALAALAASAVVVLLGAAPVAASPANVALADTAQPERTEATFSIRGGGNAAAQTVVPSGEELGVFAAWLVSESTTGHVTASLRTEVRDPASEVAAETVDLGALGGTGEGWLEFDLADAPVTPGEEYAVVLQAHGTDGDVDWWGTRTGADGPASWNYDLDHWGGWMRYGSGGAEHLADRRPAYYASEDRGRCVLENTCWRHLPAEDLGVQPAGLVGMPGRPHALSAFEVAGARYLPGSSVLELADGSWLHVPEDGDAPVVVPAGDPAVLEQVEESRAWLASGDVPGRTAEEREMAERALLDMRLLLQDNGAVAAAWHTIWRYSWPRDSAFTAVAFARAGFLEEALRILRFNASTQRADGTWEARTLLDGSGPPDNRAWQLDANGWVPWATWQYLQLVPGEEREEVVAELYPTVRAAADYAADSLDENGVPPARPDYWESGYPAPNLGTAAPLLAGLRSAAAIAQEAGEADDAARWSAAAARLQRGIDMSFGAIGYQRTVVDGSGKDSAVTWLAPPFNPAGPVVMDELDTTWDVLVQATGGVQPGQRWGDDMTWTPETMFFALAWANEGQTARATELVEWMDAHRTAVGAFPEKVSPQGHPAAVATLGWTASLTLLTLDALEEPLPTPPVTDAGVAASVAAEPGAAAGAAGGLAGEAGTASGRVIAGVLAAGAALALVISRRLPRRR